MEENERKTELENQLNPGLTVEVLLEKLRSFLDNKITEEEFNQWGEEIVVRTSIPLTEKMIILSGILQKIDTYYSISEVSICDLYRDLFFTLYLRGYLGIISDENEASYDNYDMLEPFYGPWIESRCIRDITIFKEMLFNSINLGGVIRLAGAVDQVNLDSLEEATESNKKVIRSMNANASMIENLKDIMAMNDPMTKDLATSLRKSGLDSAMA